LQSLLASAAASLKEDLAPGHNPVSLQHSCPYLELSNFLCCGKGVLDPVQLLQFFCMLSLMGKMRLGRLSENMCLFFIVHLAQALSAYSDQPSPELGELALMQQQVMDVLTIILPVCNHLPHSLFLSSLESSFSSK